MLYSLSDKIANKSDSKNPSMQILTLSLTTAQLATIKAQAWKNKTLLTKPKRRITYQPLPMSKSPPLLHNN